MTTTIYHGTSSDAFVRLGLHIERQGGEVPSSDTG